MPALTTSPRLQRRTAARIAAVSSVAALGLGAVVASGPAHAASTIRAGVVGDVATVTSQTGVSTGVHTYGDLERSVPTGRMITFGTDARWAAVAAAQPGSSIHNDLVRWAQTIKSRGSTTFVAFEHEPEISSNTSKGTPAEFRAAYRKFVEVFRAQGATNVRFTLQLTDWAFRAPTTDRYYATNWYPGDAYVDVIGGDAYNWYTCGEGRGRWVELSTLAEPIVKFAQARGKLAALPEYGVHKDPRRAQWLQNAHAYLDSRAGAFAAVYYYQYRPTNPNNLDCSFKLESGAEFAAFGTMLKDFTFIK